MNISDLWPVETPEHNSAETWEHLLALRTETFTAFAELESKQGFLQPKVSIRTTQGQEMVRILAFRVLEELGEAHMSTSSDHYYEELIDALNYLLSIFVLTGEHDPLMHPSLARLFEEAHRPATRLTRMQLGDVVILLGAQLGDLLRNRSWMQNTQNPYFDASLLEITAPVFSLIFANFDTFEKFWQFFIAKDNVLQFRLRTQY